MSDAIVVKNLSKRYGAVEALVDVSLAVPSGGIYGLVGPNGAGKTTLIKALVGLLRPTAGQARVLDLAPIENRSRLGQIVGYMPQEPAIYDDLSARDNVRFFAAAAGVSQIKERVAEILRFVDLEHRARYRAHTFSGGMKKRLSLACALVHQPRIIFLDEPTAAVDPELKQRSWELFRKLAAGGATLLISTHLLDEALLCDQVAVLQQGRLVTMATPEELVRRGRSRLKISYKKEEPTERRIKSDPESLAEALKEFGLEKSISAIDLQSDNLETVILSLIKRQK